MVLFEDALKIVLSQDFKPGVERVALSEACGRILAGDIFSDMDMPPFDKSAVDGYACQMTTGTSQGITPSIDRAQIIAVPNEKPLLVVETISAGTIPKQAIVPGRCSKIMTGAMVPRGADCVIMVEDTESAGENLVRFTLENTAKNICYQGEDIRKGELVLQKGIRITPAHMAVLASVGATDPLVSTLPRVGIFSTGDELVEPGTIPGIAQIRNSNASQLEAQVRQVPALPTYYGIAPDKSEELYKIIDLALANNDLVILTGGVSMGDFDFVPAVMKDAGVDIFFKRIAIQPGKPTVFGRRDHTFIFGLPGNPVSSFVIFEMLVKPLLHLMMGSSWKPLECMLPLGVDFSRHSSARKSMVPVIMKDGVVFPVEYHGSAHINAYSVANGIMNVPIGTTTLKQGEQVHVRLL